MPRTPSARSGPARETSSSEKSPHDLFTTLARASLFLSALQTESLADHELTFTEFSVLRLLQRSRAGTRTPSSLAKEIVCTTGAMTKLIDRLERDGLVARRPDPEDRRGIRVELTGRGAERATAAAASYRKRRRIVLGRLKPKDAAKIQSSLEELLFALDADRPS